MLLRARRGDFCLSLCAFRGFNRRIRSRGVEGWKPEPFPGFGVLNAVSNLQQVLAPALEGESFSSQAALDHRLQELDGTSDKSNLGANTLLAVH